MKTRLNKNMRAGMHREFMKGLVMPSQPALDAAIAELTPVVLEWWKTVISVDDLAVLERFGDVSRVSALRVHTNSGQYVPCPGRQNSREQDHAAVRLNTVMMVPDKWERYSRLNRSECAHALNLCATNPPIGMPIDFGHLIDAVLQAQDVVHGEFVKADLRVSIAFDAARYVEDLIPFWPEAAKWLSKAEKGPDLSTLEDLRGMSRAHLEQ